MKPLFRIPSKVGFLSDLFRQLRENIQERTIVESKDIRLVESTNGVKLELKPKAGGAAQPVSTAHPFQIYSPTAAELTILGIDSTNAWRKFFVRCGYVNGVKVIDGTDRSEFPDDGLTPQAADFPFPYSFYDILITVPASTDKYYIWLDIVYDAANDTIQSVFLDYGTDPASQNWDDWNVTGHMSKPYGASGQYFIMLGYIKTTASVAKIRQFVRTDIHTNISAMMQTREYAVCIDGVVKYALIPSEEPTTTPSQ